MLIFLQFIAVKIPWQSFYKNRKKQRTEKRGRAGLATCARNEVLTWPSGCSRTSRLLPPPCALQRRLWFQIFLFNIVLAISKQHYSRDPKVSYNFIALTVLSF